MNTNKNLPTLTELYSGELDIKKKQNELNVLLNQPPREDWVKKHPLQPM